MVCCSLCLLCVVFAVLVTVLFVVVLDWPVFVVRCCYSHNRLVHLSLCICVPLHEQVAVFGTTCNFVLLIPDLLISGRVCVAFELLSCSLVMFPA